MTKTFQTATIAAAGTADAEELRKLYHIEPDDLVRVLGVGKRLLPNMDTHVKDFYVWMKGEPFYEEFFSDGANALTRLLDLNIIRGSLSIIKQRH